MGKIKELDLEGQQKASQEQEEEAVYLYGVDDLLLTKTQHTKNRSKYVTITDSNGDVLGKVEIYIIEPYEEWR